MKLSSNRMHIWESENHQYVKKGTAEKVNSCMKLHIFNIIDGSAKRNGQQYYLIGTFYYSLLNHLIIYLVT